MTQPINVFISPRSSTFSPSNPALENLRALNRAGLNSPVVRQIAGSSVWEKISKHANSKGEPCLSQTIVYKIDRLAQEKGWNAFDCLVYLARCFPPQNLDIFGINPKDLESKMQTLYTIALRELEKIHAIDKADSCHNLDFSHSSQISVVPLEIQKFVNITGLKLEKMGLQYVPDEVCKLIFLDRLSLKDNPIHYLPESVGELKNLEVMLLSETGLRSLPESFGKLSKLHTLDLDENQFSSLPPEILKLEKLRKLLLNNNRITSLKGDLRHWRDLEELCLSGNRLKCEHISDETLLGLPKLTELDLADNELAYVPLAVAGLKNLTYVSITLNPLLWISKEILESGVDAIEIGFHFRAYKQELLRLEGQQGQPCSSPLGKLYQAILRPDNNADIQSLFNNLSEEDRNLIMDLAPLSSEDDFEDWVIEPRITLLSNVIIKKYAILMEKLKDQLWVDNHRSKLNEILPKLVVLINDKASLEDLLSIADYLEELGDFESPLKKRKT